MSTPEAPVYTKKDFMSDQIIRWCPGCGDYAILSQAQTVFAELGIPREQFAIISGIGCSSRFPYYINAYGFHTIHGRAFAVAGDASIPEEAARIEWLKTYTAELERLKGIVPDGEAQSKASRLANAQSTQNPVDNSKAREALNLELQLVTAKAEGNKEEAARLEWLQRYNSELERAKQAGMDNTEAQNFAAKMADSQNSGESGRAETGALFASSMARIGAGGNFVSGGGDMMLNESRRQTSLLEKIARGVNRTPSDRGNGGYVLG
jgi:hypothetical protein